MSNLRESTNRLLGKSRAYFDKLQANSSAERSANFSKNASVFYKVTTVIVALFFFFLIISHTYLPYSDKVWNTEIGKTEAVNQSTQLTLESWKYNPETHLMEVMIHNEDSKNSFRTEYKVAVRERKNLGAMEADITVKNQSLMVIHIQNVPEEFKAIKLSIEAIVSETDSFAHAEDRATLGSNPSAVRDLREAVLRHRFFFCRSPPRGLLPGNKCDKPNRVNQGVHHTSGGAQRMETGRSESVSAHN